MAMVRLRVCWQNFDLGTKIKKATADNDQQQPITDEDHFSDIAIPGI